MIPLKGFNFVNMKKLVLSIAIVVLASCGGKKENETKTTSTEVSPENAMLEKGKEIFEGKGTCTACHKPAAKVIGPSLQEISKIYKDKNASIVTFLKGEGEPIVDPSQFEVMKTNFAITKNMTDEELQALEAYVMSF